MSAWSGVPAILLLMMSATIAARPETASSGLWPVPLRSAVSHATSVHAFRLREVLESKRGLRSLKKSAAAEDEVELSASARNDFELLVLNQASYVGTPEFASSCGFVVTHAYLFESPGHQPVWWLLSNCGKAVLANESSPASGWSANAHYLTRQAAHNVDKCNGRNGAKWLWADDHSCLGP